MCRRAHAHPGLPQPRAAPPAPRTGRALGGTSAYISFPQRPAGSSLHWDSAFHAQFSSSAGYLQALTRSPALSPHFTEAKNPKPVSCSHHHLALRTPFPKEAGLVPQQGQRDVRMMLGGDMGAGSCGPPCPDPPVLCPAGRLCSLPRK